MLFMVIERFGGRGRAAAVYRRFRERGRMTPEGLKYVGSWVEEDFGRCFQLMECEDPRLLEEWAAHWRDLGGVELFPVLPSPEAAEEIAALVGAHGSCGLPRKQRLPPGPLGGGREVLPE